MPTQATASLLREVMESIRWEPDSFLDALEKYVAGELAVPPAPEDPSAPEQRRLTSGLRLRATGIRMQPESNDAQDCSRNG